MSTIVWQKTWIPGDEVPAQEFKSEFYLDSVSNTKIIPLANEMIPIPDPKAFRSMSRASLLLSSIAMEAKEVLDAANAYSPFSIGIYCAVENGPIDAGSTIKILQQPESTFAESYRKLRNPKLYLKQLPNLAPAQMGISFKLLGRMNVYTHSTAGSIQALEQAEWDLKTKKVQYAAVCSSFAFDDYLVVKRARSENDRTLCEGAGLMILKGDDHFTDRTSAIPSNSSQYYGISDSLIQLMKGRT